MPARSRSRITSRCPLSQIQATGLREAVAIFALRGVSVGVWGKQGRRGDALSEVNEYTFLVSFSLILSPPSRALFLGLRTTFRAL
jgi:hypothetical protein